MSKFKRRKLRLLALAVIIAFLVVLPIQTGARNNLLIDKLNAPNRIYLSTLALSWGDIWTKLQRKKGAGGSRNDRSEKICLIVPGKLQEWEREHSDEDGRRDVWNTTPLFLWQGQMEAIEVGKKKFASGEDLMWSHSLQSGQTSISYAGKPLQSGVTYYWWEQGFPNNWVDFRILTEAEHQRIATELEQLKKMLEERGLSAKEIALARVNYFTQAGLWSDAIREIYSQPALFSEAIGKLQSHDFCTPLRADS